MSNRYPRHLAERMCRDAAAFYRFGWLLGTSGNLSTRIDADSFLVSASGKDKGELTPDDFLVCGLDAKPTGDTPLRPSAETPIHAAIYERFAAVGAIYHVHEPYSALCSGRDGLGGVTVFRDLEMLKGLDIWAPNAVVEVPVLPNHSAIPELARAIDESFDREHDSFSAPGVNIFQHGFYAWGTDNFEAKRHVETLAYLFRHSWEASRWTPKA